MNIALVGAHRATKLLAPYTDTGWEVWSCSCRNESELPRQDLWFEMHVPEVISTCGPVYTEWLKTLPNLYMIKEYPDFPNAKQFPIEEVISEFGPFFLTGTISFMMALAILKKPKKIGLWGISNCPEYSHQKSSIFYFIQKARDRGIEVISPAYPEVLQRPKIYGYEDTHGQFLTLGVKEVNILTIRDSLSAA